MKQGKWEEILGRKVHSAWVAVLAAVLLLAMNFCRVRLKAAAVRGAREAAFLDRCRGDAQDVLEDELSLRDLKGDELARAKDALLRLTKSRQSSYESGLELQEEQRILQKQWEMLTTYLQVNLASKRVAVMRAGQALESYPVRYSPPKAFGGEDKPLPHIVRIVSKERYAAPERGKSEEVNGHLEWQPPQMGTSVRANALGEYVMFTNSPLILHGPPKKAADHEEYAHYCLGLYWAVARRLYEKSFIGEKILIEGRPPASGNSAKKPRRR